MAFPYFVCTVFRLPLRPSENKVSFTFVIPAQAGIFLALQRLQVSIRFPVAPPRFPPARE
ncbi:hypothetical protein HMPREF9418_0235 [Neisseria macacae ATCC 33926]|uniref:Uncharacterized protein n=1 Tax=Neisseria macacae ATCC 33926 TaxID=997348 RepID=A0AA36ULL6_9NEIS|nr:hypothetical protein HMPREF9418_0235 [Neisseria macacae ATCC 33926]